MAIELFKPFVMREIVAREYAGNVKAAKRMVERGDERLGYSWRRYQGTPST